jgi:hypothetical protein
VIDGAGDDSVSFGGRTRDGIQNGARPPVGRGRDPNGVFSVRLREGEIPRVPRSCPSVLRSDEETRRPGAVIAEVVGDGRFQIEGA